MDPPNTPPEVSIAVTRVVDLVCFTWNSFVCLMQTPSMDPLNTPPEVSIAVTRVVGFVIHPKPLSVLFFVADDAHGCPEYTA
jgi:hypothetical protein